MGNNSGCGSMIIVFVLSTGREGEEKEMGSPNKNKKKNNNQKTL